MEIRRPKATRLCCSHPDDSDSDDPYISPTPRSSFSIHGASISGSKRPAIPPGLSFDRIVSGDTCYPVRCRDFMSYLAFVEFNAENLKFYLWAKDYTRRFNNLYEADRALSPAWTKAMAARSRGADSNPLDDRTEKLPDGTNVSEMEVPGSDDDDITSSVQPFRSEITAITSLFLLPSSSLELNLSDRDRAATLLALRHTTHPTALLPALNAAEAALRYQSHPNFVHRATFMNSNPQRSMSLNLIGYVMAFAAIVLAVLLVLSHHHRGWRTLPAVLAGAAVGHIVSGQWAFCTRLFLAGFRRNLEPWEAFADFSTPDEESPSPQFDVDRGVMLYGFAADEEIGDMVSLDFDGFDEKSCKDNIATFKEKGKFERAFEDGVRVVDPAVRKRHITMACWIYGLSVGTVLIFCAILMPLPKYGII